MMLIGQTDESLQKFAWLLQTLAEDDVKDAETKFQLCNNLACYSIRKLRRRLNTKNLCLTLYKDDAASSFLRLFIIWIDWLPDSAE